MSILRQMFGPSRDEIWAQLAKDLDATLVPGSFMKDSKVTAQVGEWIVTLDTFSVSTGKTQIPFTRLRAPYVNADGLQFWLSRRNFFRDIAKKFGAQDIEIGDLQFDRDFIIKGNNPAKVQFLFANARLRDLIQKQPDITLEVKDDEGWFNTKFPEGVDELCFTMQGVVKDVERLKWAFVMFAETLHQLCHIGSAYENDPGVRV